MQHGMQKIDWPTEKLIKEGFPKLDSERPYFEALKYKESFGCLKAIGLTNHDKPEISSPLFEAGRSDRMPVCEAWLDVKHEIAEIQVRVFRERKETFITGFNFYGMNRHLVGSVELHDYGDWETYKVEEGYQIVGL